MTDDQREAYEERAAILQFDAWMSRKDAERLAYQMVMKKPLIRYAGSAAETSIGSKPIDRELKGGLY